MLALKRHTVQLALWSAAHVLPNEHLAHLMLVDLFAAISLGGCARSTRDGGRIWGDALRRAHADANADHDGSVRCITANAGPFS